MTSTSLGPEFWRQVRVFIFDLDGTLIDSKLDLALSVNATLEHFGFQPLPHEEIFGYIGQGAPMLVRRALGHTTDDALVQKGLEFFLGYYREHMLDNTVAYPGVREGLAELAAAGRILTVLTNKPERFSRRILEGLGLADFFLQVYGGNSFERKKPDPIGIETILRETGEEKDRALMVGDSEIDILTARNAGIRVCGVNYGLGSHLLDEYPPDLRVDSLTELSARVRGQS
ncbi:MAG TPA: HAD-IA family hydrolase [Candidatus Acidoferrales bacterium]|nr:HAD-IA family hydrolase [Candidatus Acidoferrales bacterium]